MSQDSGEPRSSRTWWTPRIWWFTTPSTRLKIPQPAMTSPKWNDQLGAIRPCCQARMVTIDAASTRNQVTTWKKPSARVLTSSPASVVIG